MREACGSTFLIAHNREDWLTVMPARLLSRRLDNFCPWPLCTPPQTDLVSYLSTVGSWVMFFHYVAFGPGSKYMFFLLSCFCLRRVYDFVMSKALSWTFQPCLWRLPRYNEKRWLVPEWQVSAETNQFLSLTQINAYGYLTFTSTPYHSGEVGEGHWLHL